MTLRCAYNTNGAANYRLDDALALIAMAGYGGVARTLVDPYAPDLTGRAEALVRKLRETGPGAVKETGARYLLDPRAKHEPTLVNPEKEGREKRADFPYRCVEVPAVLSAPEETGIGELVCVESGHESPRAHAAVPEALDLLCAVTSEPKKPKAES